MPFSRREFLKTSTVFGCTILMGNPHELYPKNTSIIEIGGFTKELQYLSYQETARIAAKIGWDGIECPVRPNGQVLPEKWKKTSPKWYQH
jgi:hypothetical protein